MHQPIVWQPEEISVNGKTCPIEALDGVEAELWGIATLQPNGKYHCYAKVGQSICRVEIDVTVNEGASPATRGGTT